MKFPLSWLKEYIDLNLSPTQIARCLTSLGVEVDALEKVNLNFTNVLVAQVLEVMPHPNADKLCLASVTDGTAVYEVVCGAPNCHKGMKTAFASIGATLIDEAGHSFKIRKTKLRGIESHGMLCSLKELGIANEDDGIVEFTDHIKLGADLSETYGDTIFHVSLTPNLGHCSSLIGIARELEIATGTPLKKPTFEVKETNSLIEDAVKVKVESFVDCPRYTCRLIRNVKVKESPVWLQRKLTLSGLRPVNVVVDVTNYVLLEMGQPLHAFDFSQIEEGEIVVRRALAKEHLVTLDGKDRELTPNVLIISDSRKPLAIAGVMGGANSEVTNQTTDILLESAFFKASTVRKSGKSAGVQTDASRRFEKEVDPNGLVEALDRAASLIVELSSGNIAKGIIDAKQEEFSAKTINCRLSKINQLLGIPFSVSEVEAIFHRLNFHSTWDGQDTFHVRIPTYRRDLFQEVDLIEEVIRVFGYENIPKQATSYHSSPINHAPLFSFEKEVKNRLVAEGLQELITCDLIGPKLLQIVQGKSFKEEDFVRVLNPTSIEQSVLRTSLLPGLLEVVKYNFDHECQHVSAFEVGRIHFKEEDGYKEQSVVGIVLMGEKAPYHIDPKPKEVDFFDLKGIIENLLKGVGIEKYIFHTSKKDTFHPGRQASITVEGLEIGSIGQVHPAILKRLDLPRLVLFAEFDLQDLYQKRKPFKKQMPLPIYPSSERDWTITLDESLPVQRLLVAAKTAHSHLLEDVSLLDIYKSDQIGASLKNVTLHFIYRDRDKTFHQEDVDREHERITNHVLLQLKPNME